jgi:hypothetical protein
MVNRGDETPPPKTGYNPFAAPGSPESRPPLPPDFHYPPPPPLTPLSDSMPRDIKAILFFAVALLVGALGWVFWIEMNAGKDAAACRSIGGVVVTRQTGMVGMMVNNVMTMVPTYEMLCMMPPVKAAASSTGAP